VSIDIHFQLGAGTAGLPFTNSAWISASDQPDPDSSNNTVSTTISVNTPSTADLSLSLTSNNYTIYEGGNFGYQLTLKNNSLIGASGIQVYAPVHENLAIYYQLGSGAYDGEYWNIASLPAGEERSLEIFVTGKPGTGGSKVTFSPFISVSNPTDTNTSDNAQNDTKYVEQNPFYTEITVSNPMPNVGDTVTYTIYAANFRGISLANVQIDAQLPPELTLIEAIPSIGIFDPDSELWVIDSMGSSLTPYTMTVVATVNTGGQMIDYPISISAPGIDDNVVVWDNTDIVSITVL
jgi:uncharacterized repeat protein (TIGR01451 family)